MKCSFTAVCAVALILAPAADAQFVRDSSGAPIGPGIASSTENVDFGDVDLDGDWDVAFADGGDTGPDQNRIWINSGGLQAGVIGNFSDETSARFPWVADSSRDIEFADIDNDGDLDIYVANTTHVDPEISRWWVNRGGLQGGALGFYADETSTRWIGLGQPGSSISPGLLLDGGFVTWSGDGDFADLDNDGDLDLVHSSYGAGFAGDVPTRMFLNDGTGRFEEFNPSGFQLVTDSIADGNPALWAEGLQQADTSDASGAFADIATSALDVDLGDLSNDFAIDVLLGSRQEDPRIFTNRMEQTGNLGFRDVSHAVLPANWASIATNYEQELGDLDGDGDLDLYGVNWWGFNDRTLANDGSGNFSILQTPIPNSGSDDNEVDFLDYDNDGDLDVFVANWSGLDKLYDNDGSGTLSLQQTTGISQQNSNSLDLDAADIDKDGDYDVFVAENMFNPNAILINTTNIPDTHPPYIPRVENKGDRTAAAGVFPVRAQVYDNAPYYITWYNPTVTAVEVDGISLPAFPSMSSQGQVFRTELPANLAGAVTYRFRSEDEYGNSSVSATEAYTGSTPLSFATEFGTGSAGSNGTPTLAALSVPFANSTLYVGADNLTAGSPHFLVLTDAGLPSTLNLPGLANLNVAGNLLLQVDGVADGGDAVFAFELGAGLPPGVSVFFQYFGVDGTGGNLLSSSNGLQVVTQ